MAISEQYNEVILQSIIKEILLEGETPTVVEITKRYNTYVGDTDLNTPVFDDENYKVEEKSSSSAEQFKLTNATIKQDLSVIYEHLVGVEDRTSDSFDRWRAEAFLLDRIAGDLEKRIESLLLLSSDSTGYLNYVQDTFHNLSKVELSETTAAVDIQRNFASINKSGTAITRIDLSSLKDTDVSFNLLTKNALIGSSTSERSKPKNIFNPKNNYFQQRVVVNKPTPIVVEVVAKLSESTISVNKIDIDLHQSNNAGAVLITPYYSIDGYSWIKLDTANASVWVLNNYSFQFKTIQTKYLKFILQKNGYDLTTTDSYIYEFGFDEIALFSEGYTTETGYDLVSKPLSVLDVNGDPQEFSKVVLETCELIPTGTKIDCYVSVSNDSTFPIVSGMWFPIDPIDRENTINSTLLDIGQLNEIELTGVKPSYDVAGTETKYINPDQDFVLVSLSGATITETATSSTKQRYTFKNSNDRILDHQFSTDIDIAAGTLEVWRNVHSSTYPIEKIRDTLNGWGLNEPYYITSIYVSNRAGIDLDFGDKAISIDGTAYRGKTNIPYGNHSVKVYKESWYDFDPTGITDLSGLKTFDKLYPYNHKLLIDGFNYDANWSDLEEKIYRGCDIIAEYYMKQVSVFDLIHNVQPNDYSRFALDYDIEDAGISKDPCYVILVKVDENIADFTREQFTIKFKSVDLSYKYLRFKASFQTDTSDITPYLSWYRIKLAH
jgi:hypothetical protein